MPTSSSAPATPATPAPASAPASAQTGGVFTFADWQEHPLGPQGTTPRLAQASVTNSFTGRIEAPATACAYTVAYTGDDTGTYTGMELVSGSVDGREGAFVLEERGTFGPTGTTCHFEVVPGSATGELTGLTGTGGFTSRHGEPSVTYTFTYDIA
ncbi:hypothetical protein AMK16_21520 [Streptomyces sp. CB00455]|uniref:DUF3224 domain-containing protein n=1 Tax=Streptomyces sp. CB00455 TaxID=1703927 RepID=UPI00093F35B1|nr:DUF3224 domain-containing protein [Streptomyces sp. CB00455]OKK17742.1 hypothetical protein AMK16_21520 [Streptomyces sp. CB00455]